MSYIKSVIAKNFTRPSAQATVNGVQQTSTSASSSNESMLQMLSMIREVCQQNQNVNLPATIHQVQMQQQITASHGVSAAAAATATSHQPFFQMPVAAMTPQDMLNLNMQTAIHQNHQAPVTDSEVSHTPNFHYTMVPNMPSLPHVFEEFIPDSKSSKTLSDSSKKYHAAKAQHPRKFQNQDSQQTKPSTVQQIRQDIGSEQQPEQFAVKSQQFMSNFGMVPPEDVLQQDVMLSQSLGLSRNTKFTKKTQQQFQSQDDFHKYVDSFRIKYKTEMCRNWELTGTCEFEQSCSFAHGQEELQKKLDVPKNYKTKPCKRFHDQQYCPYGTRCQFLHDENTPKESATASEQPLSLETSSKLTKNQARQKIKKAKQVSKKQQQQFQQAILNLEETECSSQTTCAQSEAQKMLSELNLDTLVINSKDKDDSNLIIRQTPRKRLQVFEEITVKDMSVKVSAPNTAR